MVTIAGASTFLFFSDFDDFPTLVLATVGTGAVWQFCLVAIGALGEADSFEKVVRAAQRSTAR
jgi:hypothetical protein